MVLFQQVTHGAIQFTTYEELRKAVINSRNKKSEDTIVDSLVSLKISLGISQSHKAIKGKHVLV